MSIFGSIMSSIFGKAAHADTLPPGATIASPTGSAPTTPAAAAPAPTSSTPAGSMPAKAAMAPGAATSAAAKPATVDVAAIMDKIAASSSEKGLDWRKSIVDLMKLLGLESGLAARRELATELHYTGDMHDSATMNVWLHKQVMTKLAENGGLVPAELKHGG